MYSVYFGLDKKVNVPGLPSSILASDDTVTSGLPTTSPLNIPAICDAENCMFR
jgi:hypothetical protein